MAQPNFQNFIHGLNMVMNEAMLIPNVPLVRQADHIIELLERIDARLVTIEARLVTIEARLVTIEAKLDLHPTQLFNSGAREYEPFIYPAGVEVVHPLLPVNRRDLGNMTIAECQAAAAHLGLPALPGNPLVVERRRQIAEFLGAPLR
ncbi:hypothetical protein DFP73DRAFT_635511 [Morchella snyderi]|nr:hypothetical protein DFP73DRAFT_635511 [Morchella snyderi]